MQLRAMLVQMLKTLHQCAIDGGDWSNALLLWPAEDPIGAEDFGGEEAELRQVIKQ